MRRNNNGFSLMELVVVIGIITALAGLLFPVLSKVKNSGSETKAKAEIAQMDTALLTYFADAGSLPRQNQMVLSLDGKYFDFEKNRVDGVSYKDPWGEPYLYINPAVISSKGYDIFSLGLLKSQKSSDLYGKIISALNSSINASSGGNNVITGLGGKEIWGLPEPDYNYLVKAMLSLLRSTDTGFNLAVMINIANIPIEFADLSDTGAVATYDLSTHEILIDITYALYGPIEVVTSFLAHEATHLADNLATGDTDFDSISEEYDAFYNGAMVWEELVENKTYENLSEFSQEAVETENYWLGVMKSGEKTAKAILRQYYPYLPEEDQWGDSYVVAKKY